MSQLVKKKVLLISKSHDKPTSLELFETLFKKGDFSNAKIMINGREYSVHVEVLSSTSAFFYAYFTTLVGRDTNTQIANIHNEDASPELIETMFKYIYTYYGNRKIEPDSISRENFIEKLNIWKILNFIGFKFMDKILFGFEELFDLFELLYNNRIASKYKDKVEANMSLSHLFLKLYCNSTTSPFNEGNTMYENLVVPETKSDLIRFISNNIIKPAYPSEKNYPVLPNVEHIEQFTLDAFLNIIGMNERIKFLAPLINFGCTMHSLEKRQIVIERIMTVNDVYLSQYLMALFSFSKEKVKCHVLRYRWA